MDGPRTNGHGSTEGTDGRMDGWKDGQVARSGEGPSVCGFCGKYGHIDDHCPEQDRCERTVQSCNDNKRSYIGHNYNAVITISGRI